VTASAGGGESRSGIIEFNNLSKSSQCFTADSQAFDTEAAQKSPQEAMIPGVSDE
jgi:hypothetical protein